MGLEQYFPQWVGATVPQLPTETIDVNGMSLALELYGSLNTILHPGPTAGPMFLESWSPKRQKI